MLASKNNSKIRRAAGAFYTRCNGALIGIAEFAGLEIAGLEIDGLEIDGLEFEGLEFVGLERTAN